MTSSINPNNIDGTYPIAGQDNDSQGFRDNFTNTKTNFGYAAAEITELQQKAVLNAPLAGSGTSTVNNNLNNNTISNLQLQNFRLTGIEDLANGNAASSTATVSFISTSGIETATLASGTAGQVKIFAMTSAAGGSMTITVADAAWGGLGTIQFTTAGQGCTLLYVNNLWVCVGNNGATFN